MKKLAISIAVILALGGASTASAQANYYYQNQYPNTQYQYGQYQMTSPSLNCVVLTRDLRYGSRGTDVRSLQSFLVAQNYPGSGSWMLTGFYGRATEAAVRIFQTSRGLYASGIVDANTRGAILQSCGYNPTYPTTPTYPTFPTYPTNPTYPTYPCYTYCPQGNVSISYLSPSQGNVGTTVTVTGTGFSYTGNTVRFGNVTIPNVSSWNGTSLTFTVPSYFNNAYVVQGQYNVSVTNSSGATSNTLVYTVTSGITSGAPSIISVNGPTSLNVNTNGTWTVVVNNSSNQYMTTSVNWGDNSGYPGLMAPQTTYAQGQSTLTFSHAYTYSGTFTITFTVTGQNGQQNTSTATVTVGGGGSSTNVTMYTNPSSGSAPLTTTISMYFPGCNGGNYYLYFGDGTSEFVPVPADLCNATITRSHTYNSNGTFQITLRDNVTSVVRGQTSVTVGSGSSSTWITPYPQSGTKPLAVSFNTYPGAGIYNGGVIVLFGDGTSSTLCNTTELCTQRTITHTYTNSGTFYVTMQGVNNGVTTTLGTATVIVYN